MGKRRGRQLSVSVIPDDGSRTLEFKVSYWLLRGAVAGLLVLVAMVVVGGVFYLDARYWEDVATSYRRENVYLRSEAERVEDLAQIVMRIKQVDLQLREMLSPPLKLAPAAYTAPASSQGILDESHADGRVRTVLERLAPYPVEASDHRWTPSIWPVSKSVGWVTAEFEETAGVLHNQHLGIDIVAPRGTPVHATADGRVVFAGVDEVLGLTVAIDHYDGAFVTRYGHNSSLLVAEGEEVRKGQPMALVGSSGLSSGPHLHYEVVEKGRHQNPRDFLPE